MYYLVNLGLFGIKDLQFTNNNPELCLALRLKLQAQYNHSMQFLFKDNFNDLKQEYFYAIYLDSKKNLIEKRLLFMGTVNRSVVHPREVFKNAYLLSSSYIICIHNHPSGDPSPSIADNLITEKIKKAGEIMDIPLRDHIILGEQGYYSYDEKKVSEWRNMCNEKTG